MSAAWSLAERDRALARAEREGVDLLVVGGGITGAGVLRDAASRGLRTLLVERDDFASGTSSRSSKLVHGGMRYIGEGALGVTRESCRERDLLRAQNPNLIRPLPFLFPAYRDSKTPLWQVRSALWVYHALANFRSSAASRMLAPVEVLEFCRDLRRDGLRGAGLYTDAQVDDARLVLETLKSARSLGAEAVNHAELVAFEHGADQRISGARVRDRRTGRSHTIAVQVVVNAAGPSLDRVRDLDRKRSAPELRPAKGVHLVIPRQRIHSQGAVVFEAADGRHLFLVPWEDVTLLGTTDSFSEELDEPVARIDEVHYLLSAANRAFPKAALTTNDLRAVFAGVRPLAGAQDESKPSSSVSREHRIYRDPSGLLSVAGGKLTTFRAMAERIVARVIVRLPRSRRAELGPSLTRDLPLRSDDFDAKSLGDELIQRFGISMRSADHLVRNYGASSESLLAEVPRSLWEPIGSSAFLYAEIPWCMARECPVTLCDLLERRMRLAIFAESHALPQLPRIVQVAAEAAGWDAARSENEAADYAQTVRRRYQIMPPARSDEASGSGAKVAAA